MSPPILKRCQHLAGRVAQVLREDFTDLNAGRMLVEALGSALPHLRGNLLRTTLWRAAGMRLGARARVMGPLHITGHGEWQELLRIGSDTLITGPLRIDLSAPVIIGDRVRIGQDVLLLTNDHELGPSEARCGALLPLPIAIGDGAWLSSRCIVLPGITIGAGAIVAAGAVVTRDVAPDTLVAGVPARFVRSLEDDLPRSERLRVDAGVAA